MSYAGSLDFLLSLQKHGIKLGLETVNSLLDRIGNPHRRYPTLHIGGTNGKGSTAALTASILQAAGYRVGLYTSPHLVEFGERIRLNGQMIPHDALVEWIDRLRAAMGKTIDPTFFEFTTAMAFAYFAQMEVDIAVIEVGMGGRFDATNVLQPLASVITNVALDHEAYLGHTVSAIAFEKGGIIKSQIPVVVGRLHEDGWSVIQEVARSRAAPVLRWGIDFRTHGDPVDGFEYEGRKAAYRNLVCPLPGRHQLENAGCALTLVGLAADAGFLVTEGSIRSGLRTVRWEGRLEVMERNPTLMLDGGHNPAAGAVVADFLAHYRERYRGVRIILVLGCMRDKDRAGLFKVLAPAVDEVVVTQVRMPRAATVEEMCVALQDWSGPVHTTINAAEALACARRLAGSDDLICVTGSLMLVGEIKALLRGCEVSGLRG